jgi:tryptophan-rich sensory protein
MKDILALMAFAAACVAAAAAGSIFRPGAWYEQLAKPSWRPPNWLFAPVWTILYLMIAISGWLVWRQAPAAEIKLPLAAYFLQLLLNAIWTPIFFGLHRTGAASIEIVLVWISIACTIVLFWPISTPAALLLVPYLLWVSFAAALNISIYVLNRGTLRG